MGNSQGGVFLTTLKAGSFFGEIALLDIRGGHRRSASVFTSDFTELQIVPGAVFAALCDQNSIFKELLSKIGNKRIKHSRKVQEKDFRREPINTETIKGRYER